MANVAGNTPYDNEVLQVKFENQYKTKLDLMPFVTLDNSLVGVAGDKVKIDVYTTTDGTESLAIGAGNTKTITVSQSAKEYEITLLQNRFSYNDEQVMKDPNILTKGIDHQAVDMFNTSMALAAAEFNKATLSVKYTTLGFDAIVDAQAALPNNEQSDMETFILANPADVASIRKGLKDDLKYVEAYVRTGYIGTVAGVNIYSSKVITAGAPVLATKEAVTYFNKLGTEIENERTSANERVTTIYARKYGLFALTDATKVVKFTKGA